MSVRIGTDLIEIERIRLALERPGFRNRCFTTDEQAYCESRHNPAESYAARFCGKEAGRSRSTSPSRIRIPTSRAV